ncbi:uncharacterized protein LOC126973597 isoform X2 [Leptidea sinapis]|uniref:uncharacterized protein LOC126973597 isoform X2 n=1 Tax=Leptidea sinapis TaxID=189913 RepID=UPI0021C2B310|nr:uncharacterized protein LOC126973597 isoform X2 [Leptidea sinapis]
MTTVRFRFFLRDVHVRKFWKAWTRSYLVNTVVRRFRGDKSVRDVLQCFKQVILRPRRTFILSATAICKGRDSFPCDQGITDSEIQLLQKDVDNVQSLMKATLFCTSCGKRLLIDKKHAGISYCVCKESKPEKKSVDGWFPFLETEEVIIWRKEYKAGQGLYAYKVYGRYKDVLASDFAAVQIDGAYRKAWDNAVASLSVVKRGAMGVPDQAVLHWEVLWPRLFANRDYVYLRRHKQFDQSETASGSSEDNSLEGGRDNNRTYVIVSKSCEHPDVPETRNAIRVVEYWSHMVVRSTSGVTKPGMEFVLTYYDEPAVGGLPGGVAAWASSRAAPDYLDKMKIAAVQYKQWAKRHTQELPDFTPFGPDQVSYDIRNIQIKEEDMESSKLGPELNGAEKNDKATQTDLSIINVSKDDTEYVIRDLIKEKDEKTEVDVDEEHGTEAKEDKSKGSNAGRKDSGNVDNNEIENGDDEKNKEIDETKDMGAPTFDADKKLDEYEIISHHLHEILRDKCGKISWAMDSF